MAFHLVDRILAIEGRERALGTFRVPAAGPPLSPCLLAEAVGQLASWMAMVELDFAGRPVAGLAAEVTLEGEPPPGATLALAVEVSRLDESAIAYGGTASLDGRTLMAMKGCVGPMMPTEEFDDPASLRARYARLREGGGAEFDVAPDEVPLEILAGTDPAEKRARFRVPESAPLFAAHFARRPVFPGTLLLDAEVRLAAVLAREAAAPATRASLRPRRARGIKFRAFLSPGDVVEIVARVDRVDASGARIRVSAERAGQRAGDARIEIAAE